jgi:Uma2 family endonuclease
VHLGRGSVVQPDLVVLRNANRPVIGPRKLSGVPDLLVEILSPTTRDHDRRYGGHWSAARRSLSSSAP